MGCYMSRKIPRDGANRIFRVYNVNDLGAELNAGKIEVSSSDLILYQRGKEPIKWPLRCLRRYGFDEELFSFESGRRCPTGPGIYAFKCRKAEELFNLVQESIQRVGQEGHVRTNQTLSNGTGRQSTRPASLLEPSEPSVNGFLLSGNGHVAIVPNDDHLYVNGSAVAETQPNYVNTAPSRGERRTNGSIDHHAALIDFLHEPPFPPPEPPVSEPLVNYADLDLPRSTENLFECLEGASAADTARGDLGVEPQGEEGGVSADIDEVVLNYTDLDVFTDNPTEVTHQPDYINVGADGTICETTTHVKEQVEPPVVRRRNCERDYENLGSSYTPSPAPTPSHALTPASAPVIAASASSNRQSDPGVLNYIEIDVNKSNDNVSASVGATATVTYSAPDSPSKCTESYAKIDFPRTQALATSAKAGNDDGEGSRKTRHNSTIT